MDVWFFLMFFFCVFLLVIVLCMFLCGLCVRLEGCCLNIGSFVLGCVCLMCV